MHDLSETPINPQLARLSEEDLLRRHKRALQAVQEAKSKGKVSAELEQAYDELEAEYNRRQRFRTLH
jgi:hypothetical protein